MRGGGFSNPAVCSGSRSSYHLPELPGSFDGKQASADRNGRRVGGNPAVDAVQCMARSPHGVGQATAGATSHHAADDRSDNQSVFPTDDTCNHRSDHRTNRRRADARGLSRGSAGRSDDSTVRRGDDRIRGRRHVAGRISEELEHEQEYEPARDRQRPPWGKRQRRRDGERDRDVRPALARDDRMRIARHAGPGYLGIASSMRFSWSAAPCLTMSCTPRARSSALRGVTAAA